MLRPLEKRKTVCQTNHIGLPEPLGHFEINYFTDEKSVQCDIPVVKNTTMNDCKQTVQINNRYK